MEQELRSKYDDKESDFIEYLELLVMTFNTLDKIDAGGMTL